MNKYKYFEDSEGTKCKGEYIGMRTVNYDDVNNEDWDEELKEKWDKKLIFDYKIVSKKHQGEIVSVFTYSRNPGNSVEERRAK